MTPAEFALALEARQHRRAQGLRHRGLAETLAREAHIVPWARQLVPLVGRSGDRTNLEALTTWIARELAVREESGTEAIDRLYLRLVRVLDV